ncbi:hypothetical protein BASA81_003374 [Batrachochytrium salamandrivorans]|nr:hypothetical protein BASA81_003374 [Batrachochytrium salamandrivorans]
MRLFGIFVLALVAAMCLVESKKTAKEWNSFTLSKKLSEAERAETELMQSDEDSGQALPSETVSNMIFVTFAPSIATHQQRADLGVKWQLQLKSGGVTVAGRMNGNDPTQLVFSPTGLDDTRDVLRFLMEQPEIMKTRMNGNEYWNSGGFPEEYAQALEQSQALKQSQATRDEV